MQAQVTGNMLIHCGRYTSVRRAHMCTRVWVHLFMTVSMRFCARMGGGARVCLYHFNAKVNSNPFILTLRGMKAAVVNIPTRLSI